jgi:uncharacterized damage-inducible protein DinB
MSQVLVELFHGKGAHVDPIACIEDLSADLAAKQIPGFPHSIGQLVFHMNYWMSYELRRIRGEKPQYPQHAAESFPPGDASLDAKLWDHLRRDMAWCIAELTGLAQSPRNELDREIESSAAASEQQSSKLNSLEAILWQMVAHNSYHTGQIAMIRQALNVWPPRAGGDTW